MSEEQVFSLNPETFTEGGGLLDDVDATIKEANYEMFTYPNTSISAPALKVVLTDDDGQDHTQHYTCGDSKNMAPSGDGTKLIPLGKSKSLSKDSNPAMLMPSLLEAGFPTSSLNGSDCTVLVGIKAHWLRKPVPKKKPNDKDRSVLCATEVISLPGEKGKAKKTTAKATAAAATSDGDDFASDARTLVMEVLATNGSIDKKALLAQVTKLGADRRMKVRNIIPLITDDFLGSDEAVWNFDGNTISPLA